MFAIKICQNKSDCRKQLHAWITQLNIIDEPHNNASLRFAFLTREYESNERVIAFGGQISLGRWM